MKDFFAIYDAICAGIKDGEKIESCYFGERWASASVKGQLGLALATAGDSFPAMYENGLGGLGLKEASQAIKSWNLHEASIAMAACNAYYNTPRRMEELGCAEPFENYCSAGLDFTGKTVGLIGHLHMTPELREAAGKIYTIERAPQEGDYPDSACDLLLPRCDIVLITGSSLVNKTLPHILELCRDAYTILIGPSVPMCPELLDFGIDRLSGMAVIDSAAMDEQVRSGRRGSPYPHGSSFLIKR